MHALLIDDSRAMRMILRRTLVELGFDVDEATDGRDGLERLAAGLVPDVLLVDWNMPEMTGIEFVTAARRPPYSCDARVVMVTTETEQAQMVRALEAGADEYVMKPFTRETVAEKFQLLGLLP
jgi:two-component system chemotaxis response regulator CheY